MPQRIDGVEYFSMVEVILASGVCRQTLWRWRKAGRIPRGHLLRDRRIIYTASELRAIKEFASRVAPLEGEIPDQLRLFVQGEH
jgi:predicted DNA-binding transcriptional regulator AlpA